MQKLRVGILGALGSVGQHYLEGLKDHPFFEVSFLGTNHLASCFSLNEALNQKARGIAPIFNNYAHLPLSDNEDIDQALENCDLLFSALSAQQALLLEPAFAKAGLPIVSNASAHRMDEDVPILVPEINVSHLEIIELQQKKRGWKSGFIVTKSNCSLLSYLLPLYPLHQHYELSKIVVTTLQSISGAGYQGLSALESLNNIIPYIPGEEEKSVSEFKKILGSLEEQKIKSNETIQLSVQCMRVPVVAGHLATVSVSFRKKPSASDIFHSWKTFRGPLVCQDLPTAPHSLIVYRESPFHPQPALDLLPSLAMSAIVGRLRPCPVFDYQFVALTDNLKRGAALSGIYAAELLFKKGLLKSLNRKTSTSRL